MSDSRQLPAGKLPGALLQRLLATYVKSDPSVLVGPEIGADAAAIEIDSSIIIVKSDPITFPTPDISSYLVNVNANDVACMGGKPRWMLVTALQPVDETTESGVEHQFRQLSAACEKLGISLVGGHSEITDSVNRPIMIGMLVGEASRDTLLDLRRSKPGDSLLLCNSVAIEGSAILASEAPAKLLSSVPDAILERARGLTDDPGISVVPAARILSESGLAVRGMHDPTEGGIATAIWEVAKVTNCDVDLDQPIPIRDETQAICKALDLDPLGLIASGALLVVIDSDDADSAAKILEDAGIQAVRIGTLSAAAGVEPAVTQADGKLLPTFSTDEIARFFSALSS
ncbi:MAG: AIR synthase-related protein [Thermomicrobiales bacterium]